MTRFSTKSIKSAQIDEAAAERFLQALRPGASRTPFLAKRKRRIEVLLEALAEFPELLSSDGLGYYSLAPFDSLVALGAVLRYAYRQLAALCTVDRRVGRYLERSESGRCLLKRIRESCGPSPLRQHGQRMHAGKKRACKAADEALRKGCELLEQDCEEELETAPDSHGPAC